MKSITALLFSASLAMTGLAPSRALPAELDARPPDRLIVTANGSRLTDADADGGGGAINWLHYVSPDALFGVGAEHQFIDESQWTFGTLRGSVSRGEPGSRTSFFGDANYGQGDDDGRDFDYAVAALGISQAFSPKFFAQLEARYIDVDTSDGVLPKLGLTYLWTLGLSSTISYEKSVSGNLGTELVTGRFDYRGQKVNLIVGGATGHADPVVVNLQPGLTLPTSDLKEGFAGIGIPFSRGEVLVLGDWLELAGSEKVTVTLSVTMNLGSRGQSR